MAKGAIQSNDGCLGRTGDTWKLDPRQIVIKEGFNPRKEIGDIYELKNNIRGNGVKNPVIVIMDGKEMILVAGHRRLTCTMELINEGCDIKWIPGKCLPKSTTREQILAEALRENQQCPLKAIEIAMAYQQYVNWGWSPQQIADEVTMSISYVKNTLALLKGSPDLREAVNEKKITKDLAGKIIKESEGDPEMQKLLTEEAKKGKEGKKNVKAVTAKKSRKISRKMMQEKYDSFIEELSNIDFDHMGKNRETYFYLYGQYKLLQDMLQEPVSTEIDDKFIEICPAIEEIEEN